MGQNGTQTVWRLRMQHWEDRDELVIKNTVRLFAGLAPVYRIDWIEVACAVGWIVFIVAISVLTRFL
jgi:hypothetical protein